MQYELTVSCSDIDRISRIGLSPLPSDSASFVRTMISDRNEGKVSIYFKDSAQYDKALKLLEDVNYESD